MDNKNKYLFKNTLALSIGNFGSKIITFLLVPLYTNIFTLKEYGTIDLITVIATMLVPVITLNIHEAIMRFTIDKDSKSNDILSIGIIMIFISFVFCLISIPIFNSIEIISKYSVLLSLYVFSSIISSTFMCYIRGKEKLLTYSIIGIIQSIAIATLNITFLMVFKMGIYGYLLAYIISYFLSAIICIVKENIFVNYNFSFNKKTARNMLKYSVFLIPNSLMWWIMNFLDRFMVTTIISLEANGIYSVSYKIPTILITLTTIFNQAWMYSAIKENENDKKEKNAYTNFIYSGLFNIVISLSMLILVILKPLMNIYVGKEFYLAWQYTPLLIIGMFFLTLGTFISNEYTANKNSVGFLKSSLIGAVMNLILNFLLIPIIGVMGAALATCISYISVFIFRYFDTKKYVKLRILDVKKLLSILILLLASILVFVDNEYIIFLLIVLFFGILLINHKYWKKSIHSLLKLVKKRKEK